MSVTVGDDAVTLRFVVFFGHGESIVRLMSFEKGAKLFSLTFNTTGNDKRFARRFRERWF